MKLKIRKGATVKVITGSDKGKTGEVLEVNKETMRVRVQGVKMQTRHSKQNGLVKSEGFIHYSNVQLLEAPAAVKKTSSKKSTKQKMA
jgi:large subunit ribosomal protein L24